MLLEKIFPAVQCLTQFPYMYGTMTLSRRVAKCAVVQKTVGLQRRLVFEILDPPVQRVLGNENERCDTNVEL